MNNINAAHDARDRYNADYLADFYDPRRADILASGDATRIRLYEEWLNREARRAGKAA